MSIQVRGQGRTRFMQPIEHLRNQSGKGVFVKLKDGSEYMGKLRMTDAAMNLVLDDAKELTETNKVVAQLGTVFIRGSNLLFVSLEPEKVTFFEPQQEQRGQAREEDMNDSNSQ
ncbi:U6 snRNA-associated Sm-like protein LSm6 [Thermofilum pendens]|nr:U6 snRNA-associated Sm-like protein LSm6 [Thermofilum pendens]